MLNANVEEIHLHTTLANQNIKQNCSVDPYRKHRGQVTCVASSRCKLVNRMCCVLHRFSVEGKTRLKGIVAQNVVEFKMYEGKYNCSRWNLTLLPLRNCAPKVSCCIVSLWSFFEHFRFTSPIEAVTYTSLKVNYKPDMAVEMNVNSYLIHCIYNWGNWYYDTLNSTLQDSGGNGMFNLIS